jgi:hypothetical protein
MNEITLDDLRTLRPGAAAGTVRRLLDGVVLDEAAFLFSAPALWRVRHRNGEEIVVRDEDWWSRSGRAAAWSHDRAEPGTTPHHHGYLHAMLFPALLPAIGDDGSAITRQETRPDGSRRLTISHREPVAGVVTADVSPEGHLTRIEGRENGREGGRAVIELSVDSWEPVRAELFDPDAVWECSFGE